MHIEAWWLWLILAAVFIIGEIFTAGFFLFWFGIGAVVACILAFIGLGPGWQWLSFITVSLVLFAISRRFAEHFTGAQPPGVGADRLIGKVGIVVEDIDNVRNTGRVRVDREEWRADSEDGKAIAKGKRVEVLRIDGTHLVVKIFGKDE